jgi:aspartate/methionine/tyrosine aminotransferase
MARISSPHAQVGLKTTLTSQEIEKRFLSAGKSSEEAGLYANDVFSLDLDELKAAITPRTRAVVINTPHNPTGKMLSRRELESIANIVKAHDNILVFSDEVRYCCLGGSAATTTACPTIPAFLLQHKGAL